MAELDLTQFEGHTPGDWLTRDHHSHVQIYVKAGDAETTIAEVEGTPGDVALVLQSPQLLAELKEARARIKELEAEKESYNKEWDELGEVFGDLLANAENLVIAVSENAPLSLAEALAVALVKGSCESGRALIAQFKGGPNA